VERSEDQISDLITAAQRAYAEKDMCHLRLAELQRKSDEECALIDQRIVECEREFDDIEETIHQRDLEVEEMQRETSAAMAEARREEEAREAEMEHFASVRNQRLELAHGVEEMFTALGVGSLTDLLDAYKMTASKVLSLWQKQAEQEADVERLEHEIRALQADVDKHLHERVAEAEQERPEELHASEKLDESTERMAKREKILDQLCATVKDAFDSVEPLRSQHGAVGSEGSAPAVTPNNLILFLSLVERTAISLVRKRAVEIARDAQYAPPQLGASSELAATGEAEAADGDGEDASECASDMPTSPDEKRPGGGRKRASIPYPSMGGGALTSAQPHETARDQKKGRGGEGDGVGGGGSIGTLKYGRRSLRSELMVQILSGVDTQMDKLADEEILIKAGEKIRDKGPGTTDGPPIDKGHRDSSIDAWLSKRRGELRGGVSVGVLPAPHPKPPDLKKRPKAHSAPTDKQQPQPHHKSAPALFASGSHRELIDCVTRLSADVESRQLLAADSLPKIKPLPPLAEEGRCRVGACSRAELSSSASLGLPEAADVSQLSLADPTYEIAEINRRLAHLQVERQQIAELKEVALAASNLTASGHMPVPTGGADAMNRSASFSTLPPPRAPNQRSTTSLPPFRR